MMSVMAAEEQTSPIARLLPDDERALTAAQEAGQLAEPEVSDSPPLVVESAPLPIIGKSWAFDFVQGRFMPTRTGGIVATRGRETLRFWVEKCLRTPRRAFPIYDDDYGLEGGYDLIGGQYDPGEAADLGQRITDALLYHPRITAVTGFSAYFDPDEETLWLSFTVVTDQGDMLDFQDFVI